MSINAHLCTHNNNQINNDQSVTSGLGPHIRQVSSIPTNANVIARPALGVSVKSVHFVAGKLGF